MLVFVKKNVKLFSRVVENGHADTLVHAMHSLAGQKINVEPRSEKGWYDDGQWTWHESWLRIPKKRPNVKVGRKTPCNKPKAKRSGNK